MQVEYVYKLFGLRYITYLYHPQILVFAMRGNNDQSYVAIDQFEFLASDTCDFEPKEAWPTEGLYMS